MPANTVTLDLETRLIARAYAAPKPICAGWFDGSNARVELIDSPAFIRRLLDWLYGSITIANHNVAWDFCVLMEHFWDLPIDPYDGTQGYRVDSFPGLVFDKYFRPAGCSAGEHGDGLQGQAVCTLITQQLIDVANGDYSFQETQGYDLEWVAQRNSVPCIPKEETWRLYYAQLEGIDPSLWPAAAVDYVLGDVRTPMAVLDRHLLWNEEFTRKHGSPQLHDAPFQCRAALSLELASAWGVRTDRFRVEKFKAVVDAETTRLRERLMAPTASYDLLKLAAAHETRPLVRANGTKDTKAAKARMVAVCAAKGLDVLMTEPDKKRGASAAGRAGGAELKPFVPQVCLNEDACVRTADPILLDYADFTSESRTLDSTEDLEHGMLLPLQTKFVTVRDTGRTSSRKPSKKSPLVGMQMQNFARGYLDPTDPDGKRTLPGAREALCPRGWTSEELDAVLSGRAKIGDLSRPLSGSRNGFFWVDFTAAEMHTLAQSCKDLLGFSILGDMLNKGVDPHTWFGGIAFEGFAPENAWELSKSLDKKRIKVLRTNAKPENFGFPGGMGAAKFQLYARKNYGVTFELVECERLRALWLQCFPEMPELFKYISALLDGGRKKKWRPKGEREPSRGMVRLARGGRWRGAVPFPAACNLQFQGPCSNGAKRALARAQRECFTVRNSPLYGCRVWNFVHDEIPGEGPLEQIQAAAERLSIIAAEEFNEDCCPDYPTDAEPIIGLTWSKQAGTVRDPVSKELLLWDAIEALRAA